MNDEDLAQLHAAIAQMHLDVAKYGALASATNAIVLELLKAPPTKEALAGGIRSAAIQIQDRVMNLPEGSARDAAMDTIDFVIGNAIANLLPKNRDS